MEEEKYCSCTLHDYRSKAEIFFVANANRSSSRMSGSLWMQKSCSVICANCHFTCNNSNVDLQESDEEVDTETVSQQTFDEIEEEGDEVEEDNTIAENLEQLSIHEVLLSPEDQELAKPGPSGIAKRRRMH